VGSNITAVFTSCNRHALLKSTLNSFIQVNCGGAKPDATIIIEDGDTPMPEWLRENIHFYSANIGKVTWIQNEFRRGLVYSIDRAYALVKTDYIFHCEDDWQFNGGGSWAVESKQILERYPKIIQVSLRGDSGWHQLIDDPKFEGFKIAMPYWRGGWGGLSFNVGLRRLQDWKDLGSYGKYTTYGQMGLGFEIQLSKMLLDKGFRIADLNRRIVEHTGGSCSRMKDPAPTLPKILIAVPVCHKLDYTKWESGDSPTFDKAIAYNGEAYGTGIHISGENNRIQALRDTWLRDVKQFESHVTYKLFYGTPHNRPALDDEVYLDIPDDYAHLPHKTIAICKYAKESGHDVVFKADDDSLVNVARIVHEALSGQWDYAGYLNGRVASGGPGYFLTKRAFSIIADHGTPNTWAEDVAVSKILFHHNIQAVHLPDHYSGRSDHWVWPDGKFDARKLPDNVAAMHAVQPDVLRQWYAHKEKNGRS